MYLWNTHALASKLKNRELSEAQQFNYFLLCTVFAALVMEFSLYVGQLPSTITLTESFSIMAVTVIGTLLSYKANKKGDNKEFIIRYICLSVPISVKLIILALSAYMIYMIFGFIVLGDTFDHYTESATWIDVSFSIIFQIVFFWRLIHHIKWISDIKNDAII